MPDRAKLLNTNDARVARARRQLTKPLERWIKKLRLELTREALDDLKSGRLDLKKIDEGATDQELLEILALYGVRQADRSGSYTAEALREDWIIPPQLVSSIIADKAIKVKHIRSDIVTAVRETIRAIMQEAERADPRPSMAQLSRTIQTELADLHAVSPARAALIARTESLQNESTGIFGGMEVAGVDEIEWLSSRNPNHGSRAHQRMDGETVKLGEYFTTPLGNRLRYPGDPSGPISETANCFPGNVRVAYEQVEKGYRREYRGAMVTIETASDRILTGTPNHPVLTPEGWVGLGTLAKGGNVVCRSRLDVRDAPGADVDDHPLTIKQVFDFLSVGRDGKFQGSDRDFHGDGRRGEVDVVSAYGKLMRRRNTAVRQHALKLKLALAGLLLGPLMVFSAQRACRFGVFHSASRAMRGLGPAFALLRAQLREADSIGLGAPARHDASTNQPDSNSGAGDVEPPRQGDYAPPFPVEFDKVVRVDVMTYSGHVFNLQTAGGLYTANGVVVHNCG
jgi:hypothetical protein